MEDRNRITRLHTLLVVCLVLFAVLLGRMVYLQLWRGDYYAKQSDGNRLRQSRILAPRGIIYDSEGKINVRELEHIYDMYKSDKNIPIILETPEDYLESDFKILREKFG